MVFKLIEVAGRSSVKIDDRHERPFGDPKLIAQLAQDSIEE